METTSQTSKILFPRPFAFAIDDLGWMSGTNSGDMVQQGPYRIGLNRLMTVNDYQCIVDIAKKVGVRIQGLFILAELDIKNILAKYPTTTWMGTQWDNAEHINSGRIEPVIDFIKNNAAYLEFGLHGIGHEFWQDLKMKRAEWYCVEDAHPWPEEEMRNRIGVIKAILSQHGLDDKHGHSFPESFVPSAYSFHWNPDGDFSTGHLLKKQGARYANTLFDFIPELASPTGDNSGEFDHGLLVVNRMAYGNDWYKLDVLPTVPLSQQKSDIVESHWSNWLAQDTFLQESVNQRWVDYYKAVQIDEERYLAKNSEQLYSQWLYKRYTRVFEEQPGKVTIDNSRMSDEAYSSGILANMVLKIRCGDSKHISSAHLNGKPLPALFEESGYGFLYLPRLEKKQYTLTYAVGSKLMTPCIFNDGTYNVYFFDVKDHVIKVSLRLYGTQDVTIRGITKVDNIVISNPQVILLKKQVDLSVKKVTLTLKAHDFQGETTDICIGE